MNDLTIKNLDAATLRALRARSAASGRSVEQEAAELLSQAAGEPMDRSELLASTRRIRAMTPNSLKRADSTQMIREDRDRR